MIRFTYNDRTFDVDINHLSINEALEIKRHLGITVGEYSEGILRRNDAAALAALVFVAHRRAGETVDWDELGRCDVVALITSVTTPPADEPGDDAPADPEPAGSKPAKRRKPTPATETPEGAPTD